VPLRVVLIGGLVALLAGIAIVLSQSGHELTGSNLVKRDQFVVVLQGGQQTCQLGVNVPAGTGRLGLEVGTYGRPGPPLLVTAGAPTRPPALRAGLPPGWHEGTVTVPVRPTLARAAAGQLCIRNGGRSRIAVAGSQGVPSVYYEAPHATSWWSRLGRLADRAPYLGSWALWIAVALVAAAVGVAVVVMLRVSRDPAP
jgi:hypothetical protein